MKKLYTLLFAMIVSIVSYGQVIIAEDFDYPNGSLVPNGGWASTSGTAGDFLVESGQAVVQHGTPSEDVEIAFSPVTGDIFAGFDFSVDNLGAPYSNLGTDFEYFAHFSFRAQMDIVPPNGSGDYTVGISSDVNTAEAVWATDLTFGVTYRAIIRFNQDTGTATLWINPATSSDTSIAGTDDGPTSITSFDLRQSDSDENETIRVDDLMIGQTFNDVLVYAPIVDPTITVGSDVTGLDYFENNGPSAEQSFDVSAINLGANLSVTVTAPFAISENSGGPYSTSVTLVPDGSGTVPTTPIYVILENGEAVGSYSTDATVSSTGAVSQTVGLSGDVSPADPQISITGTVGSLDYGVGTGPSAEDSFFVSALFLQTDLTVTAPANFEVASDALGPYSNSVTFSPDGGGTVSSTEVFIRLEDMLAVGPYSGDVTASSTGATDEILSVSGNVFGANTNALVITGVYDGPLSGGTPKGVELYVLQNIPDLSLFGLGSANNGEGTDGQEFTFPSDAATAGDFIYVSTESTNFTAFFGFAPNYTSGAVAINGDDAVELFENGSVIDTFGDINTDGSGEPWDHLDGWAYRNDNTGPDGSTFVLANWSFSGINVFDGETSNSTAATPFPIGTYMATLSVDTFDIDKVKLFPNPTSSGAVTIGTPANDILTIGVFDVLGKQVLNTTMQPNTNLDVSGLKAGIYIVRIVQNNNATTKKLVIR